MKAFLFLLCFIDLHLSLPRPVGHKYYLIKTKLKWPAAQTYCRENYEDLATVESGLDWLRLNEELKREDGVLDMAWVGLYDDVDSWRWSFNDTPFTDTHQEWYPSQPDNLGGDQFCMISRPLGYWWDYPCGDLFPFICYNANNDYATRYVGVDFPVTWTEAKAYCREFHTDLAIIRTAADNNAMQAIAVKQGYSWLGGYRDAWKWSDGENTSNVLWLAGQPDNALRPESCAALHKGSFKDFKCTLLYFFICHITRPVRERQMIKLQVTSDESIFDSAVQSAMLDLIKEKLREKGMLENTTVTWRVQPDGEIFYKKKKSDL